MKDRNKFFFSLFLILVFGFITFTNYANLKKELAQSEKIVADLTQIQYQNTKM
ncbi:MAG: hypothetical protein GY817_03570, partial [bacterium]|nr:hypothetical protein [bacterium]